MHACVHLLALELFFVSRVRVCVSLSLDLRLFCFIPHFHLQFHFLRSVRFRNTVYLCKEFVCVCLRGDVAAAVLCLFRFVFVW